MAPRPVLWALALCLAAAAAAQAQDKVIRFGVTGDYPPFALRDADGRLVGADIQTAQRIANDMGARAEFVPTEWTRLEGDFAAGRFDVALGGLTVTPARAALGDFTGPLMDDGKRPLARCAERERYASLEAIDRPGVRVMINRGPEIGRLAKQWFSQASVTVHADDATLVDPLLTGNVDVWITDGVVVDLMARRYPGRLCAATRTPFTHVTKAWLVRRDPALFSAIDSRLRAAVSSGAWQAAVEAIH